MGGKGESEKKTKQNKTKQNKKNKKKKQGKRGRPSSSTGDELEEDGRYYEELLTLYKALEKIRGQRCAYRRLTSPPSNSEG